MSQLFEINAEIRENTGKSANKKLRDAGKTPANIYGSGTKNHAIAIDSREITKRVNKGNFYTQVCEVAVGKDKIKVIPKELSLHPVTDNIEHVDFYQLDEKKKVKIKVKINFINEIKCIGVKKGGALNITARRVELLCFPKDIISEVEVDLEKLNIGESIHVSDLNLSESIESAVKSYNPTIVTIVGRAEETEATTAEETTEESATEEKKEA